MTRLEYSLEIRHFGFCGGNFEKQRKEYYFQMLDSIPDSYSHFNIEREGIVCTIDVDWSQTMRDYKQHHTHSCSLEETLNNYEVVKDQYDSLDQYVREIVKHLPQGSTITIQVHTESDEVLLVEQIVMNFIYHIYLALNLSCPGFLDLYAATLSGRNTEKITISNYYFSECWADDSWPSVSYIPVEKVRYWYDSLELWGLGLGKSRLVKCLFALLHFCSEDKISPSKQFGLPMRLKLFMNSRKQLFSKR
ncbi:hypothetical protein B5M42_005935 [Paenibacillus athensensis]|uniref:Uncharacterized protein n=1 Tax=Paenibacillus athensensis TaxID=1967502 RepID=A0A4Y8Q3X1_9BACL|nr:hypothetical protein [Paenibacillus athensensis]MCD1258380.1 hypothetical protein [Paenibacillus athensensis]